MLQLAQAISAAKISAAAALQTAAQSHASCLSVALGAHLSRKHDVRQEEVHHVKGLAGALPDAHEAHPARGHLCRRAAGRGGCVALHLRTASANGYGMDHTRSCVACM